jgi:hypothetical protein
MRMPHYFFNGLQLIDNIAENILSVYSGAFRVYEWQQF